MFSPSPIELHSYVDRPTIQKSSPSLIPLYWQDSFQYFQMNDYKKLSSSPEPLYPSPPSSNNGLYKTQQKDFLIFPNQPDLNSHNSIMEENMKEKNTYLNNVKKKKIFLKNKFLNETDILLENNLSKKKKLLNQNSKIILKKDFYKIYFESQATSKKVMESVKLKIKKGQFGALSCLDQFKQMSEAFKSRSRSLNVRNSQDDKFNKNFFKSYVNPLRQKNYKSSQRLRELKTRCGVNYETNKTLLFDYNKADSITTSTNFVNKKSFESHSIFSTCDNISKCFQDKSETSLNNSETEKIIASNEFCDDQNKYYPINFKEKQVVPIKKRKSFYNLKSKIFNEDYLIKSFDTRYLETNISKKLNIVKQRDKNIFKDQIQDSNFLTNPEEKSQKKFEGQNERNLSIYLTKLKQILTQNEKKERKKFLKILISRPDSNGEIPLHLAVKQKNEKLVELLVQEMNKNNMSLDRYNINKETPLHLAVIMNENSLISTLILGSASCNVPDKNGYNAVQLVIKKKNIEAFKNICYYSTVLIDLMDLTLFDLAEKLDINPNQLEKLLLINHNKVFNQKNNLQFFSKFLNDFSSENEFILTPSKLDKSIQCMNHFTQFGKCFA